MAAVFLAEHIQLRRRVALKILHPPPDADESGNFEKRFRLEAETLATLDHPNIVTLYDYGEAEDGRFYLAMEYIEGPRFTDLLGNGALPADRAIRLLLAVCTALRYAHKKGVIHRDLKPSNLLLATDDEGGEHVKVVDFGLVKVQEIDQALTREGLVLGSPHCMAPEQVRGGNIDHRADIYAIGVLLFRSLTGVYPFHGASSTATMVAHLNDPIPTFASVAPELNIPARLEDVVRRCLAKRPADRYPDVKSLMDDLASCIGLRAEHDSTSRSISGTLVPPRTESPNDSTTESTARPLGRDHRRWPVALLALLLLLSISGAVYLAGHDDAPPATPPTTAVVPGNPPGTGAAPGTGAPAGTDTPPGPGAPTAGASVTTPDGTGATPAPGTVTPPPPGPGNGTAKTSPGTGRTSSGKAKGTGDGSGKSTDSTSNSSGKDVPSPGKPEIPPGYMPLPDDFK